MVLILLCLTSLQLTRRDRAVFECFLCFFGDGLWIGFGLGFGTKWLQVGRRPSGTLQIRVFASAVCVPK